MTSARQPAARPGIAIRQGYADTPAGQIHYREVAGHGPTIVLLHRTPVGSSGFARVLNCLAGMRRVVALDTPGFGQSFQPGGNPSTGDYAGWLLDAMTALGIDRFHLGAHHTGTHFAVDMAGLAPDRVLSLTLSGILYAPADERARALAAIAPPAPITADGLHLGTTWKLMQSLFLDHDTALVHAETMAALGATQGCDQAFAAIHAQDFGAAFARVRCPVQVVQAADDPLTLTGMLSRFRADFPAVPVIATGPAFLALPERQSGAFSRALLAFTDEPSTRDQAMTNRRYHLVARPGGYDLARADTRSPLPGPGEVVVRVHAVSLNNRDLGVRNLGYPVNGADHFTPLSDAAGEVIATGPGVTQWQVGDKVMSSFFQNWQSGRPTLPAIVSALGAGGPGVFADEVVLSAGGIVALPGGWSYAEGAALPCAGVTAWNALITAGQLQPGDTVLVIGTGGVATFALQIAVAAGARVIVLSSSADKIARAIALGASAGIDYRQTPDWVEAVRALTDHKGVDHVVELGGDGTLARSIASLDIGGHLALIGALDGFGGQLSALPLIFSALRISAIMVGPRSDQIALAAFMADKGLRPVIDSIFAFDDAQAAYDRAAAGASGKVVISLAD